MRIAMPVNNTGLWADPVTGQERRILDANPTKDLVEILPDGDYRLHPLPKIMGPSSAFDQMYYKEFKENTRNINPEKAAMQYSRYILEEMMPKN